MNDPHDAYSGYTPSKDKYRDARDDEDEGNAVIGLAFAVFIAFVFGGLGYAIVRVVQLL